MVAIVLRAFIQLWSSGSCGLFGEGGLIMHDVSAAKVTYSSSDILAVYQESLEASLEAFIIFWRTRSFEFIAL